MIKKGFKTNIYGSTMVFNGKRFVNHFASVTEDYYLDVASKGRIAKLYEYQGKSLSVPQWEGILGMSAGVLYMRLREGLTFEQAIKTK